MGILDEDVARVREATDLVALASEHIALRRVGTRFSGLCPFHAEKSPSFSINPALGVYYCFGCGKSGDAITFVREIEHLEFVDAVERLAARANITLRYDDASAGKDRQRKTRLVEAVAAAVDFYHHLALESPEAGIARRYLRSRGFDGDVARQFSIGYSPDAFDRLSLHLQQKKFARDDLVDAGLSFVNRANKMQDVFRGRLMFPIFDGRGEPVGFGARLLQGEGPKYKNSSDGTLYQKSRLLYGLNWAKGEIVARNEVIICEGYTDVIAFVLAGVPNAVATCGTALADDHFQILKNLTRTITLAYDADAAGQNAAARAYQWEQKFEVQFRVAALPPGRDPADVWADDPAKLRAAAENAKPFLQFRVDRVLAAADLVTAEGRARAAADIVPVLREHPNELVREGYIQQVAGTLGFEHSWFKQAIARAPAPDRIADQPVATRTVAPLTIDRRELEALRIALHQPGLVVDVLEGALFADPLARATYDALVHFPTPRDAMELSDPDVRVLLERLAVEEPTWGEDTEAYAIEVIANLTDAAAQRRLRQLVRAGDAHSSTLKILLDQFVAERDAADWPAVKTTVARLLPWTRGDAE
jgi:DNA primase